MLARATTPEGDLPPFLQPRDGKSSDNVRWCAAIQAIQEHWRAADEAPSVSVTDQGVCSEATRRTVNPAKRPWIRRVSETATEAKAALAQSDETWHVSEDGRTPGVSQIMSVPQGKERGYLFASPQRAQASVQRQGKRAQAEWETPCWHVGHRRVAGETDAQTAREREKQGQPAWRDIPQERVSHARHAGRGRHRKENHPRQEEWHLVAPVTINQERVEQEAFRNACWIMGTTLLETTELSDQA